MRPAVRRLLLRFLAVDLLAGLVALTVAAPGLALVDILEVAKGAGLRGWAIVGLGVAGTVVFGFVVLSLSLRSIAVPRELWTQA